MLLCLILTALACAPLAAGPGASGQAQSASGQAAAWSRYTYPGEEFSAELPGMPLVYQTWRAVNNDYRKSERMRVFSLYNGGVIFFVVAYDNPHSSESLDFFAAHLRGAWGLTPKASVTLSGFEGMSYNVVGVQRGRTVYDLHGEGRVFRTKKHAYLALALSKEAERPEVERFLNAFALGASPVGESIAEEESVPRYVPPKKSSGNSAEERMKLVRPEGTTPMHASDEPFTMQEVGHKALIIYKPEPPYTEAARMKEVSGVVRLRVVLSATGRVTDIEVVKSLPNGLTESAIRVARQLRFFPAEKDGRPVSQYVVLENNYNIY